jgi:hypothetical protein
MIDMIKGNLKNTRCRKNPWTRSRRAESKRQGKVGPNYRGKKKNPDLNQI